MLKFLGLAVVSRQLDSLLDIINLLGKIKILKVLHLVSETVQIFSPKCFEIRTRHIFWVATFIYLNRYNVPCWWSPEQKPCYLHVVLPCAIVLE